MTPDLAAQLADLGGWTVCIFLVGLGLVGLYRRWWVPGWIYEQEQADRAKAETQAQRNSDQLERLVGAFEDLVDDVPGNHRRVDART